MKHLSIIVFLMFVFTTVKSQECYLSVEKSGDINPITISDFAIPLISQYVTKVNPIPLSGVRENDCVYRISLSESREEMSITVAGEKINAYGDSKYTGVKGVKEALLKAIYRARPNRMEEICKIYKSILTNDCGTSSALDKAPPPPQAPPPINHFGYVQINVNRAHSKVYVNGQYKGEASPNKPLNLRKIPIGQAAVNIISGSQNQIKTCIVKPNQWTQLVFNLESSGLKNSSQYLETFKTLYTPHEPIIVNFKGLPGNPADWITIVAAGSGNSNYGEYFYSKGQINGKMRFSGRRTRTVNNCTVLMTGEYRKKMS